MLLFHSPRSKTCSIIFIIIVVHNEKLLLKYISHFCKFDVQTTKAYFFLILNFPIVVLKHRLYLILSSMHQFVSDANFVSLFAYKRKLTLITGWILSQMYLKVINEKISLIVNFPSGYFL